MKYLKALLLTLLLLPSFVSAETFVTQVMVPTQYWFRGTQLTSGPVIQLNFDYGVEDWTVSIFTNMNMGTTGIDENDIRVSYTVPGLGDFKTSVGIQTYFVYSKFNTHEFYASQSLPGFSLLESYDYTYRNGLYLEAGINHTFDKILVVPVVLTLTTVYNLHYERLNEGFAYCLGDVSIPITVDEYEKLVFTYRRQEPFCNDFNVGNIFICDLVLNF